MEVQRSGRCSTSDYMRRYCLNYYASSSFWMGKKEKKKKKKKKRK